MDRTALVTALTAIAGPGNVSTTTPDLVAYSSDMWPRAQIWRHGGEPDRHAPDAVVWVGDRATLSAVLRFCHEHAVPVVPCGAGSGVCGGTLPARGGVALDVKRMNRIVRLDARERSVVVEAGRIGQQLELALSEAGFTLGHFPSSIYCSTVGGYVAARSAGQFSSRYGVFEDIVQGLTVALPDGRLVATGTPFGGPDWTRVFVGSEGTLGVVVDATLRLHPSPTARVFRGFQLPSVGGGLVAMRRVMQAGLRPAVLRLYDPFDTLIAGTSPPEEAAATSGASALDRFLLARLAPLVHDVQRGAVQALLARPAIVNALADRLPLGCLLVAGFEGGPEEVARDAEAAWRVIASAGGRDRGPGPGEAWYARRYAVSFKQSKVFMAGAFVDTMEVSTTWDRLPALYRAVREALSPFVFLMAHFSHAYREGCSIYFTMVGRLGRSGEAEALHHRIWEVGLEAVTKAHASISHHHGIGIAKRRFLPCEYGPGGAGVFAALKSVADPAGVMNPDKLWPSPDEALRCGGGRTCGPASAVGRVEPHSRTVRVGGEVPLERLVQTLADEGCRLPWWPVGSDLDVPLGELLATPHRLDWGPRLGGIRENVLSVEGVLGGRHVIHSVTAPRRAAGPDLSALLLEAGGRHGTIRGVVLRVDAESPSPVTLAWCAPSGDLLVEALQRLLDAGVLPSRATLLAVPAAEPTLSLLFDRSPGAAWLADIAGRSGARPVPAAPTLPDDAWPALPASGFRDAIPASFAVLEDALLAAQRHGLPVAVSRVGTHGAWLVPLGARPWTTLRTLRQACHTLGRHHDATAAALSDALAEALAPATGEEAP